MAFKDGRSKSIEELKGASFEKLIFPEDLHSQPKDQPALHQDFVRIGIHSKPGADLKNLTEYLGEVSKEAKDDTIKSIDKKIAELNAKKAKPEKQKIEEIEGQITNLENRRKGLTGGKFIASNIRDGGVFVEKFVRNTDTQKLGEKLTKGNDAASRNAETPIAGIYLPMPENVTYNEPVEWQGTDLGSLAPLRDKIFEQQGPSAGNLAAAGLGQIGNVIGGGAGALVTSLLGGGALGGALLGALGGGATAQGAIESTFRIKSNPFKEQTFGGVPFRPFEFSWTLAPQNYQESLTLDKIIRTIRAYQKPSFKKDSDKTLFNYPDEFTIHFMTIDEKGNPQENQFLPRIKNLVCKSVNTNYTAAGWRSFKDGAPNSVTLQLGFEEIDIITRDDVLKPGTSNEPGPTGGY